VFVSQCALASRLPFATLQERAFALLERERLIDTATYMAKIDGVHLECARINRL
jgi:hypothetical protein